MHSCCARLQAWNLINAKAQPLLLAVPALQRVVEAGQRWFEQPMQQTAAGR
jgi:hypothetical protein